MTESERLYQVIGMAMAVHRDREGDCLMDPNLVFVVEDDADLAELVAEAVQLAGLRVEILPDGRAALERIPVEQPGLILLDLHLPKVSGDEILRLVRSTPALALTTVLVVTADAVAAEQQAQQDLADLVVVKPVTPSDLRTLVERFTGRRHEQHA